MRFKYCSVVKNKLLELEKHSGTIKKFHLLGFMIFYRTAPRIWDLKKSRGNFNSEDSKSLRLHCVESVQR